MYYELFLYLIKEDLYIHYVLSIFHLEYLPYHFHILSIYIHFYLYFQILYTTLLYKYLYYIFLMHLLMNIKRIFSEHLFCLETNSCTLAEMSWFILISDLLIRISTFDLRHHSHKKRHIHLPKAHRILVLFWVWYVRNLFEQTSHLPQNIYKNLFNFITWY